MTSRAFRPKGIWLSLIAFGFDLCAVAAAWLAAYLLRFNGEVSDYFWHGALTSLLWVLPVYGVAFRWFGLYLGIWVFASMPDLFRIAKAVAAAAAVVMIIAHIAQPDPVIPRSVLLLSPVLLAMIMGGARALYRGIKEYRLYGGLVAKGKPVIVLGAGRAATHLIRELARSSEWRLIGLLDDDPTKAGRQLQGHKVLGELDSLAHWARVLKVEHAIIAMPSASPDERRRAALICVQAGVKAMVLPTLTDFSGHGQTFLSHMRQVNLEDLLGREPVQIDTAHVRDLLAARVVMVTGAGGSIGSELCRQIARFAPAQLVAYDISEYATYLLVEEMKVRFPNVMIVPLVGDVKDTALLNQTMARYSPSIVFHAAAYKHVPLMEERNAWQAVRNNTLGTYRVASAAIQHHVQHCVLISTDKAVNPTNVMGASKRLAEIVCQALQQTTTHTRFETVRFGNVLGSAGSVIPKFQEQIAAGRPVTVTHPEVTRFFMTIPEAAQLVLQASAMGNGGEIFILDMGKPLKIIDVARALIRLYGFSEEQIRIEFTGLRPGEKLYEELLADEESTKATAHRKLRIAQAREVPPQWLDTMLPWLTQRTIPSDDEVRRDLRRWLPEYTPAQLPQLELAPRAQQR